MSFLAVSLLLTVLTVSYPADSYRFIESEYWCEKDHVLCADFNDYLIKCNMKQSCDSVRDHRSNFVDCISKSQICDGKRDCRDGSDEIYCPYVFDYSYSFHRLNNSGCSRLEVQCKSGNKVGSTSRCILKVNLCDNAKHCNDGSDETFCPYNLNFPRDRSDFINRYPLVRKNCSSSTHVSCEGFLTGSAQKHECVQRDFLCDAVEDCSDGSDERYCPHDLDFSKPLTTLPERTTEGTSTGVNHNKISAVPFVTPAAITEASPTNIITHHSYLSYITIGLLCLAICIYLTQIILGAKNKVHCVQLQR